MNVFKTYQLIEMEHVVLRIQKHLARNKWKNKTRCELKKTKATNRICSQSVHSPLNPILWTLVKLTFLLWTSLTFAHAPLIFGVSECVYLGKGWCLWLVPAQTSLPRCFQSLRIKKKRGDVSQTHADMFTIKTDKWQQPRCWKKNNNKHFHKIKQVQLSCLFFMLLFWTVGNKSGDGFFSRRTYFLTHSFCIHQPSGRQKKEKKLNKAANSWLEKKLDTFLQMSN